MDKHVRTLPDQCVMPVPADAPPIPASHPKLGKPSARWRYLDASGTLLFEVLRFDTPDGKEIRPLSLWRGSGGLVWRWKAVPELRPLYGLDKLAARPDASVVICEGEKSADAAAKIFPENVCMTSPGGSQAVRKADWTPLAGRRVLISPDADEPGAKYATAVATTARREIGCEVSVIDAMALASMAPDGKRREPKKGWDAADAVDEWQDLAALRESVMAQAKPFGAPGVQTGEQSILDEKQEFARLAKLKPVEYERERKNSARALCIGRVTILDKLVANARPNEGATGQGRFLELPEPEPWDDPVDGAELLDEIETVFARFVVCDKADRTALALWCFATWFEPVAQVAPILNIVSPVLRCGKSTTLALIGRLVKRALSSSNISAAAVFRTIEKYTPTLLLDEADASLASNEELRGLINSGHTRE